MKESGEMTNDMALAMRSMRMEMFIKESFIKVKLKEEEFSIGGMGRFMKGSFMKDSKKALEHGKHLITELLMLGNGKEVSLMDTVFLFLTLILL